MLLEELSSLEEVLFAGHTGVVVKLTEAVMSCPPCQDTLLQLLLSSFHVEIKPKLCVPLLLTMTAYEVYLEEKEKEDSKVWTLPHNFFFGTSTEPKILFTKTAAEAFIKNFCCFKAFF